MDYTNHDFFLYKDTKDILIYDSYADLFHITNLSLHKDIIKLESAHINKSNHLQWEISYDLDIIKILPRQILASRAKRGINELGTLWKWTLNAAEIQEIYKHEQKPVVITDILDISKFKIAIHQELIVIYIKYPIITNRCEVFNARSISHNDGKLLIDNHVAKCNNRYYVISIFKTEIFNNYGTLSPESTCFTRLLNGEKSLCKKIREYNKKN